MALYYSDDHVVLFILFFWFINYF